MTTPEQLAKKCASIINSQWDKLSDDDVVTVIQSNSALEELLNIARAANIYLTLPPDRMIEIVWAQEKLEQALQSLQQKGIEL